MELTTLSTDALVSTVYVTCDEFGGERVGSDSIVGVRWAEKELYSDACEITRLPRNELQGAVRMGVCIAGAWMGSGACQVWSEGGKVWEFGKRSHAGGPRLCFN